MTRIICRVPDTHIFLSSIFTVLTYGNSDWCHVYLWLFLILTLCWSPLIDVFCYIGSISIRWFLILQSAMYLFIKLIKSCSRHDVYEQRFVVLKDITKASISINLVVAVSDLIWRVAIIINAFIKVRSSLHMLWNVNEIFFWKLMMSYLSRLIWFQMKHVKIHAMWHTSTTCV